MNQVCLNCFSTARPNVIKIDTEGAESEVIAGATEVLKQPQLRTVICELNHFGLSQMHSSEGYLRDQLKLFGFTADTPEAYGGVGNLIFRR